MKFGWGGMRYLLDRENLVSLIGDDVDNLMTFSKIIGLCYELWLFEIVVLRLLL